MFPSGVRKQGILYQVGDIVSIEDVEGDLYYAQLRGFLQDQYARKTAVITWLIPGGNKKIWGGKRGKKR